MGGGGEVQQDIKVPPRTLHMYFKFMLDEDMKMNHFNSGHSVFLCNFHSFFSSDIQELAIFLPNDSQQTNFLFFFFFPSDDA